MLPPLAALALLAAAAGASADSAAGDSAASRRVVRRFEPIVVEGGRFADPRSIESVQPVSGASLRRLPIDRLADAVGLKAGVVAIGADLHVRGGRTGELATTLEGVPLDEPRRGAAMEVPLFALRGAELLTGGLDADHAGSLAGELELQTEVPTARPTGLVRWSSDGRRGTGYDALHARLAGPLARTGLGLALAGEARLDDLGLPNTRSRGRLELLGRSFGWRQDNRLLGWAKLAPIGRPQRASLEVLGSRTVLQPYDPMFDFDGWVSFMPDPSTGEFYTGRPLATAPDRLNDTYFRYRAGDHSVMTEERRVAVVGAWRGGRAAAPRRLALGWTAASSRTSVGLRPDRGYVSDANRVMFGPYDYAWADPFHAYFGDEPYFRAAGASRWFARGDGGVAIAHRHRLRFGAGGSYEHVRLDELDDAAPEIPGVDTLRSYRAWAPGAFAYVQHRWEYGGLVWNAGLRLSAFTAGPQADGPYLVPYLRDAAGADQWRAPTVWSWSPRLGFAYPVSDRDAFSLAYSRVFQDPPRDLLYDNRRRNFYDRHPLGNGDLRPAEVISYQAALKHLLDPTWSLQLGVFYRDVWGQPGTRLFQPLPGLYRLRYEGVDDAHASGFELSLAREAGRAGRLELAYTYMNAWGTQSNLEGLAYGSTLGARPMPTGQHPLDWDERHAIALSLRAPLRHGFEVAWRTRAASGLPWTPLERLPTTAGEWPTPYADQSLLNSRRLPWNENTDVSLRWSSRWTRGATVMLVVTNLFDNRTDRLATLSGYPNGRINTLYDEYGAFRTETGLPGGAYWNDTDGDGVREWVRVHDRRLAAPPRSVRLGVELGR